MEGQNLCGCLRGRSWLVWVFKGAVVILHTIIMVGLVGII